MSNAERPFPPARNFDLSQSINVSVDFNLNPYIPLRFRRFVNTLSAKWKIDVGKTMVVLYEITDQNDYGAAVRLSWNGEEERVSLDLIPRRSETMDFARRIIEESVPGQIRMPVVGEVSIRRGKLIFTNTGETSPLSTRVAFDMNTGKVSIERTPNVRI